jgi:hypothetical protein
MTHIDKIIVCFTKNVLFDQLDKSLKEIKTIKLKGES